MSNLDRIVILVLTLILVAIVTYAAVTKSNRTSAVRTSNVCGEQQIVAVSRPHGTSFTFVLCEDSSVRGVK